MSQPQESVSENSVGHSLTLLPPLSGASSLSFACAPVPYPEEYDNLLSSIQRFRGEVYLAEGALEPSMLDFNGGTLIRLIGRVGT